MSPARALWALLAAGLAAPLHAVDFDGRAGQGASGRAIARQFPAVVAPAQGRPVAPSRIGLGLGRWDKNKVRRYAAELAPKADELLAKYRANSKTGNWLEKASRERALRLLENFRIAAHNFNAHAQGRHATYHGTVEAFRQLSAAFHDLDSFFPGAYHFRKVQAEYDAVQLLMINLRRQY